MKISCDWHYKGLWDRIFETMADDPDFDHLMVDGSIVRVHQHGAAKYTLLRLLRDFRLIVCWQMRVTMPMIL